MRASTAMTSGLTESIRSAAAIPAITSSAGR
jgi:hypothetical protein